MRLRNEIGESLRNVDLIPWARIQDFAERRRHNKSNTLGRFVLSCCAGKTVEGGVFRWKDELRKYCICPDFSRIDQFCRCCGGENEFGRFCGIMDRLCNRLDVGLKLGGRPRKSSS